jgi:O-antigen/teichoic acid export membrane protein
MMLFGLGNLMLMVRLLDKPDFGIFALFIQITVILEVSKESMVKNALIKFLASNPHSEHDKIISASFFINTLFAILVAIILLGLAFFLGDYWHSDSLKYMLLIYIITTFLLIPFSQFDSIQQGNFDFKSVFWVHFTRRAINFLGIAALYLWKPTIDLLVTITLIEIFSVIIGLMLSYSLTKKYFSLHFIYDSVWVKKIFSFGKFVFGTNLSAQIQGSIDQFMVGSMISTSSVASYRAATQINSFVEVPTMSIASIMFPQSAKRMEEHGKDAVKYLYEKSLGVILSVLLPAMILIALYPDLFIKIIAGEKYLDAVPILRITLFYVFFLPYARQFGNTLDAAGYAKVNFVYVLCITILNLLVNYFFILKFGVMGAAYGSLFTQTLGFFVSQWILYKILGINFINTFVYAYTTPRDILKSIYSKFFIKS